MVYVKQALRKQKGTRYKLHNVEFQMKFGL